MRWQHLHGTISNFRVGQLVRSELLKAQKDPMKKIIFDYLDCSLHDFTSKSRRHHLIDQTSWVRMVSKLKPYLGGLPVLGRVGCPHKSPLMTIMGPGMADLLGERSLPTIHFHTTCIFKILSYITLLCDCYLLVDSKFCKLWSWASLRFIASWQFQGQQCSR